MDVKELEKEVIVFVKENLVAASVNLEPETVLATVGLDSFSMIEIVLFLERKFSIELPDEALTPDNIKSVQALCACAMDYSNKS